MQLSLLAKRVGALCAVLLAGGWLVSCTETQSTGVWVSISSRVPVTNLEFVVRDIDYNSVPAQQIAVGSKDLTHAPLTLLIEPSTSITGRFLLHVKGYSNGQYVAMDSNILTFVNNRRVTAQFTLQGNFTDVDDDGFIDCAAGTLCDCADRNDHINPFTRENCSDDLDNDCSGPPLNKGCPCETGTLEACSTLPESMQNLAGIGACAFGSLTCKDGTFPGGCVSGTPTAEIPNNYIDDNCDGTVDEGSTCNPNASRACHLGFVDDPNNPDSGERRGASLRSLGVCGDASGNPLGVQTCSVAGTWGECLGDVLPQRNTRPGQTGWAETPADPIHHILGQCDGLDNDCNGKVDDAPEYDADRDGFKVCGTDTSMQSLPMVNPELVDCDDTNPNTNPGSTEVCGNLIDEDCRCDHDPLGRVHTDPNSEIGKPSVLPNGTAVCPMDDQYLRCDTLPRSDIHPVGFCKDGPDSYFSGFGGANQDCMGCGLQYGLNCNPTDGACSQKAADCAACNGSAGGTGISTKRPACQKPLSGTCTGTTQPQWTDIAGSDPFDDCGSVSCANFYDGIRGGQCFAKADAPASQVMCKAGAQCQGAAEVCPQNATSTTPIVAPACVLATAGCQGSTAPTYANEPAGQDAFNQCVSSYKCGDAESGAGPFYFGISNNACFLRADVSKNSCDGTGNCQSRSSACNASGMGAAVSGRPLCQALSGGCTGTTAPAYAPVARGTDPFNECNGLGCDGSGQCATKLGGACTSNSSCSSNYCVDGVCCNSACNGSCMACNTALTGQANGSCALVTGTQPDPGTCSGSTGCNGSNCTCTQGSCKEATGGSCSTGTDCATGICNCTNAACTTMACDTQACTCTYDSNADGHCDGNLNTGVTQQGICSTDQACSGGSCLLADGQSCSADSQCANTCIGGTCAPKSGISGPCDGNDDSDCTSGRCLLGACR